MTFSLLSLNCADNPSSLGLKFIPPGETTGVRIFDSYVDTMAITSTNIKKHYHPADSNLIIGISGTYNSKSLIKFNSLNPNYDSATVLQAVLKLRYRNYYFPGTPSDSAGQISFDVYKVQTNLDYAKVTYDSITSTTFGTKSQGSYTGSPAADSLEVDITLNPALVKDWLEYRADTSYPMKNYGIGLLPNASSAVLKGFYSGQENLKPVLYYIVNKFGDIDTVSDDVSQRVFLADASLQGNQEFFLQAGISYVQIMKFDVSHLPSTATINDAQLFLTLDSSASIFTKQTVKKLTANYITDTAGLLIESSFEGAPTSTPNQYMFRLVSAFQQSPFQRWLNGQTNYGLLLSAQTNLINLDRFAFYDVNSTIFNTKPRIIIKYTPRPGDKKPEKNDDEKVNNAF